MANTPNASTPRGELEYFTNNHWVRIWLFLDPREQSLNFFSEPEDRSPFLQIEVTHATIEHHGVEDPSHEGTEKRCFRVAVFGTFHVLRAQSKEERKHWVTQLNTAKEEQMMKDLETSSDTASMSDAEESFTLHTMDEIKTSREIDTGSPSDSQQYSNLFDILPDEAMIKIWSMLDPYSIGRASRVCKRFKKMSYDVPLWHQQAKTRNWDATRVTHLSLQKNGSETGTRSFYVKKFLSYIRREKAYEEQQLQSYKNRLRQQDRENSGKFLLLTCFGRPYEWLVAFTIIWLSIVAVLKLDGKVDWEWKYSLIPLYIVVFQVIFAPILYDLISSKFDYTFEEELDPDDNHYCGPIFFFLTYIMPLASSKGSGRLQVFPITLGLALFFIFAMMRIAGVETMKWWAVFIPLNIVLIWISLIFLAVGQGCFRDEQRFDRLMILSGILLLVLFFIFLGLRMEGVITWSWMKVMIPLFVLKGLAVLLPAVLSLMSIIMDRCGSYWLEDRTRWAEAAGSYCMALSAVVVLVLGPLLAFEILLAQRLDDDRETSYALIFVPLFILEGFGLCGCCIVNCAFLCS